MPQAFHTYIAIMHIHPCTPKDFEAITAIYAHHVIHGTGSFETEPPSAQEMQQRWQNICAQGWPYIVATDMQGQVRGYAYAGTFRPRLAFRYTLEDSIYIHPEVQGQGYGRMLLAELISQCEVRGARQMIAVIGDSNNQGSISLHAKLCFEHIGVMRASGWKFNRWLDTVLMQRVLGPGSQTPPAD